MGKAINRFCIPFLFALLACTNETKQLDIALQQKIIKKNWKRC